MSCSSRLPIVILFCLLLCGCGEKQVVPGSETAIPADSLIAQEKMVLILADVHVVEADLLLERNQGGVDTKEKQAFYYQGIFNKYHVSAARYRQNLAFYRQNPENFAKMYEKVNGVLEGWQKKKAAKK